MSDERIIIPPGRMIGFDKIVDFFTDDTFNGVAFPKIKFAKIFHLPKIKGPHPTTLSPQDDPSKSIFESILDDYSITALLKSIKLIPLLKYLKIDVLFKYFNIVIFIKSLIIIIPLLLFYWWFKNDVKIVFEYIKKFLYLDTFENKKTLLKGFIYNIGIIILPIILALVIFYASTDPHALLENTNKYAVVIFIIFVGFFIGFSSLLKMESFTGYIPIIVICLVLLSTVIIKYVSSYITPKVISITSNVLKLIIILMIIIGLAIGYKFYSSRLKALTGWKGFFINFLFYIPCLVSDGLEYLLQQYNITPNIVFVLLMIELLLALVYFYIPKMIKESMSKTDILLLNNPVFLNTETIVGKPEMFLFKPIDDYNIQNISISNVDIFRRNYCINMWVFLNAHSSSNTAYKYETNIFDYNMHPRITYKNETDNTRSNDKGIYTFYFSDVVSDSNTKADDSKYELSLPNQKWNLITLNYFDTKADLYINGNLERTILFSNNIPTYQMTDLVKIGKDDGLNGAICNVSYNKKPLSSTEISTLYNINYMNNPPISFNE